MNNLQRGEVIPNLGVNKIDLSNNRLKKVVLKDLVNLMRYKQSEIKIKVSNNEDLDYDYIKHKLSYDKIVCNNNSHITVDRVADQKDKYFIEYDYDMDISENALVPVISDVSIKSNCFFKGKENNHININITNINCESANGNQDLLDDKISYKLYNKIILV